MREVEIKLRGIARRQVEDYFKKKGAEKSGDRYLHPDFEGRILREGKSSLGSFCITELTILLRADDSYIEALADEFRRCFLRMGG